MEDNAKKTGSNTKTTGKGNNNNKGNRNGRNSKPANPKQFRNKGDKLQGRQKSILGVPFKEDYTDDNSSKQARRGVEIADTAAVMSKSNPVAYYTKFSKFAKDAANLPFSMPLGTIFKQNDLNASGFSTVVPGVARLLFVPTIGVSSDFTSAINRASVRFYTYLRSNQKASASYDHQDITMMEMALDSCYMFHALCTRLYGIVRDFSPVNEYYSRALVIAHGADFADLRANLQDFRAFINTFAYNLGQYALPAHITLFDRHRWMCEGLYTDSKSEKAQTYIFMPKGFWKYDNTVTTGSQLTWKEFQPDGPTSKLYTVAELMAFGNDLLNAISGEEDFAIISGDIYNFYGGDTYKLPYIDEMYSVIPAYEEVVLSQIENATIVPLQASSLVISQNPSVNSGAIVFNPKPTATVNYFDTFMNFHWDSPTPDDVIEASRLTVAVTTGTSDKAASISACGTEIVVEMDIYSRNPATGAFRFNPLTGVVMNISQATTVGAADGTIMDLLHLAQFDWAPGLRVYTNDLPTNTIDLIGWTWDICNMQKLDPAYLGQIHLACLLSLFEVGDNGEDVVSGR